MLLLAGAALAVPGPTSASTAGDAAPELAPAAKPVARVADAPAGEVVPGSYVVVLRQRAADRARSLVDGWAADGVRVTRRYDDALAGFAARMTPAQARTVAASPAVAYVEPDRRFTASSTQTDAPWGLDRIDQRTRTLNHRYGFDVAGAGVTAYVIDSGIRRTHVEVAGRVAQGFTSVHDGRGTNDCLGHGTHVAGIVGGRTYGVAKRVTIRPVRVLDCRGEAATSQVIAGIDWVTRHHQGSRPAVANLSLGGPSSRAMDAAVRRSVMDGVTYVVAAGNEAIDACEVSPAEVGSAITVAASNGKDGRASFSNYGWCVDLFAPGTSIRSSFIGGDRATRTLSGTSMAAPAVTGAAVLYLQAHPHATPAQVGDAIDAAGTHSVVSGGPGSPDVLLYSKVDRAAPAPVVPPAGNVVRNPSFERGATGWESSPYVITDDALAVARTGSWAAWLGGWGEVHQDFLEQQVTVPTGSSPRLRFSVLTSSQEDQVSIHDQLTVSVTAGGVTTPVAQLSNLDVTTGYRRMTVDLSDLAGQVVQVGFVSSEDGALPTSFRIDDVYVTGD